MTRHDRSSYRAILFRPCNPVGSKRQDRRYILAMSDTDHPTDPAVMDWWLPYLSPRDCEAALRLADVMVEVGLMDRAEAAEWSRRLRAWKLAHSVDASEA